MNGHPMTLTDEQIDELSGRELDEAVCISLGYTQIVPKVLPTVWQDEDDESFEPCYSTDIGMAMGLLLTVPNWYIQSDADRVAVHQYWIDMGREDEDVSLASGPKSEAATILCRAYLKLKNRSE